MRGKNVVLVIISCALLTGSCFYEEIEKATLPPWTPSYALPLVSSEFTAADLLAAAGPDSYVYADDNDIITLAYETKVLSASAADLFSIPAVTAQLFNISGRADLPFVLPEGDILTHLSLKDGKLTYGLEWVNPEEAEIILKIPQITKDGQVLLDSIETRTDQTSYSGTLDLTGYSISFDTGDGLNLVDVLFQTVKDGVEIDPRFDELRMEIAELNFDQVEGELRSLELPYRIDTISMGIARNWISGDVLFVNPKIQLTVKSGLDLPVLLRIDNFGAIGNSSTVQLAGAVVDSEWSIPRASVTGEVIDTLRADPANSNVVEFLSITPNRISYQMNLTANAEAGQNMKLHHDDRISVRARVEVPFHCAIRNAVLLDTFAVEIPSIEKLRNLELMLHFENSFPHTLSAQVFLADENGHLLDSLLYDDNALLLSGETDAGGHVIASSERTTIIPIATQTLEHLYKTRKLILRAELATSGAGAQPVHYTTANRLHCRIGTRATVEP